MVAHQPGGHGGPPLQYLSAFFRKTRLRSAALRRAGFYHLPEVSGKILTFTPGQLMLNQIGMNPWVNGIVSGFIASPINLAGNSLFQGNTPELEPELCE